MPFYYITFIIQTFFLNCDFVFGSKTDSQKKKPKLECKIFFNLNILIWIRCIAAHHIDHECMQGFTCCHLGTTMRRLFFGIFFISRSRGSENSVKKNSMVVGHVSVVGHHACYCVCSEAIKKIAHINQKPKRFFF